LDNSFTGVEYDENAMLFLTNPLGLTAYLLKGILFALASSHHKARALRRKSP
jgi:hypothetical protein